MLPVSLEEQGKVTNFEHAFPLLFVRLLRSGEETQLLHQPVLPMASGNLKLARKAQIQPFAGRVAHWWSFYILEALSSISSTENKNQKKPKTPGGSWRSSWRGKTVKIHYMGKKVEKKKGL